MGKRKRNSGIGRRPGGKRSCNQKVVSATSATAKSIERARSQKEVEQKLQERRQRRLVPVHDQNGQGDLDDTKADKKINDLETELRSFKAAARTNAANDHAAIQRHKKKITALEEHLAGQVQEQLLDRSKIQLLEKELATLKKKLNVTKQQLNVALQTVAEEREKRNVAVAGEREKRYVAVAEQREIRNFAVAEVMEKRKVSVAKQREKCNVAVAEERGKRDVAKQTVAEVREKRDVALAEEREKRYVAVAGQRAKRNLAVAEAMEKRKLALAKEREKKKKAVAEEREKSDRERRLKIFAHERARDANKRLETVRDTAVSRLDRQKKTQEALDDSKATIEELKATIDEIKSDNQPVVTVGKVLSREVSSKGKGGSYTWPLWMVQLILEQLVNGTPPSAVSPLGPVGVVNGNANTDENKMDSRLTDVEGRKETLREKMKALVGEHRSKVDAHKKKHRRKMDSQGETHRLEVEAQVKKHGRELETLCKESARELEVAGKAAVVAAAVAAATTVTRRWWRQFGRVV